MRKKSLWLFMGLLVASASIIVACEWKESEIYYKDKLRPISQVEEIIADELEVENPELDLEVNISEEQED